MITPKSNKRNVSDAGLPSLEQKSGGGGSESPYSYGLYNLPPNCSVIKIDVDGQKDLFNVKMDDRIMISNFIETAAEYIPQAQQLSKDCHIVIKNTKEMIDDITLIEYTVLLQFHIDTIFQVQHLSLIQHVCPLRCAGKDSIQTFCDTQNNKHCLLLTIASTLNPLKLKESVLLHQHFSYMLATTDEDDSSSKNPLNEVSINRKRARKGDIIYNKICDNK